MTGVHVVGATTRRGVNEDGSGVEVAPIPVSSGRTDRHRLHRGGDRLANNALWRIALVRMHCHQPTKDYVARRISEGKTKPEILRCLKRDIACETYPYLAETTITRRPGPARAQ
ncbi:transposase [Planosporangium mesophilum]|uniref:transposase n=1 Tax=Planosporangium mesophilum TaxID=689768 RepID=UPI001951179C|nr:transposase [Planosporangium mesophilum]